MLSLSGGQPVFPGWNTYRPDGIPPVRIKGCIIKPALPSALAGGLGEGRIGARTPVRPVILAFYFIASNEIIAQDLGLASLRLQQGIQCLFLFGFATAFSALLFPTFQKLLQGFAADLP
jgi:hypothetical protein